MFTLEKDMIPVLRKYLTELYQVEYFLDEFNSWNGIADLVYTLERPNFSQKLILDYELLSTITKYLNRKWKKVSVKKMRADLGLVWKKIKSLMNFMSELEMIEFLSDDEFVIKKVYEPPISNIISIEAKLSDWKGGMYQAIRYKHYSNSSYLAISEEYIHRVNIEMLKENNIGLISVSPDRIKIRLKAKKSKPINTNAFNYLSEKMIHTLSLCYNL